MEDLRTVIISIHYSHNERNMPVENLKKTFLFSTKMMTEMQQEYYLEIDTIHILPPPPIPKHE